MHDQPEYDEDGLRPPEHASPTHPDEQTPPRLRHEFVSRRDVEDAEDVLFAHPPRRVSRLLCACGEWYPCDEVRFAHLVMGAA
ncbi:hypothetical protein AWW66_22400 [Micromonospora rosaria]|uniref:Uncharacterized protein n=1 Tax=Micromonospora rosaria TaxID=47874 RepID=A0A136PN31_9ACTN|nr:hypothetical protein [Micromonospora rosaria]KXK59778.1 hypothetical protein AWW66_22400 [Micromonospora rosaria]